MPLTAHHTELVEAAGQICVESGADTGALLALGDRSARSELDRREQPVRFMVGPGLHNAEGLGIFAAALEPAHLVQHFEVLEPVLDAKLFLQEVAVLALVLAECLQLLLLQVIIVPVNRSEDI